MDLEVKDVANARNYEEIKEEGSDNEDASDSEQITTTTQPAEESKITEVSEKPHVDDFDKEYFAKDQKIKLNKGEKRTLKFALKRGLDVNEIEDLKLYL